MTNSSKKPAKATRDNLDLDLEARLDQAKSKLPQGDEPPTGDALDQLLADAKKEIDAELPIETPEFDDKFFLGDLSIEEDVIEEIEELEILDNFTPIKSDAMTLLENQLAAAMNSSVTPEEDIELEHLLDGAEDNPDSALGETTSDELVTETETPEINEESLMAAVDELLNFGVPQEDLEVVAESEIEENKLDSDAELTVESEIALDDLVDTVPFEDILKIDDEDTEVEISDSLAPLVEISIDDESDDLTENINDTITGFDLLDDDGAEKENAITVTESDDDWMKQLENLDKETTDPVAAETTGAEEVASDDDWMKQLEGLDEETTELAAVETPDTKEVINDDDWMKQMADLDEETTELAAVETPDTEEVTNDDDWMKQMADLDEDIADIKEVAGDDDWMSQMEDLDEDIAAIKEVAGDDDWMSQMEGLGEEATGADEDSSTDNVLKIDFNTSKEPANKIEAPDTEAQDQAIVQLRADQDIIQGENKTQFADAESKRKKTAIFSYIALSLGVIGLLGSAGVGWLSYDGKGKSEELAQSVTALEEKVDGFLAKNPEKEIENLKASVEQLNQKVEKVAAAQVVVPPPEVVIAPIEQDKNVTTKNTGKVSSLIALLKHKTAQTSPVISTPKVVIDSNTIPPINIAPEHIVPENIVGEKSDESPKLKELAKKPIEVTKVEKIPEATKAEKIPEATKTEKTPEATKAEKTPEATKAEAELLSQTIAKADAVAKAASAVKPVYTGRMTRGMAYSGEKNQGEVIKSKTPIESQKAVPVGKYSVNVVSYQQEWFAQSKAAEFKQNGIPVEVVPVNIGDNATRYRLKVTGFKTKSDANAYAEQIKKSHNLNEAWVGSGSNE
ncbi:MAG: hypothetical protein EXR89_03180 [Methylococcaceae bacterium]|nr:hypothetical protein [Methylococcaceae bacterium]